MKLIKILTLVGNVVGAILNEPQQYGIILIELRKEVKLQQYVFIVGKLMLVVLRIRGLIVYGLI